MALDPTGVRTWESSIPILCMAGTSAAKIMSLNKHSCTKHKIKNYACTTTYMHETITLYLVKLLGWLTHIYIQPILSSLTIVNTVATVNLSHSLHSDGEHTRGGEGRGPMVQGSDGQLVLAWK